MRFLMILTGILVLMRSPSLAAADGKPTRVPLPDSFSKLDLPAGSACSFHLRGEPVVNREFATTFPADSSGDVRELVTGRLVEGLSNVDTGMSIVVDISGPGRFVFHPDGSVTWDPNGRWLLFLSPRDVPAGPTAYINSGHIRVEITPTGQKVLVSRSWTQLDVCAALS